MGTLPTLESVMGHATVDRDRTREARATWMAVRRDAGFTSYGALLTPPANNAKIGLSDTPTYGLTLAQATTSGLVESCAWRTPACTAGCVLSGGQARYPSVVRSRNARTRFAAEHPDLFVTLLAAELERAVARHGAILCRLNVASDVRWERVAPDLFGIDGITFYDYTKAPPSQRTNLPANYTVTFSVSEAARSNLNALEALTAGRTATVVFATRKGQPLPSTYLGFPVVDGDLSDDRTADPAGVVVGLRAKGKARQFTATADGFVRLA